VHPLIKYLIVILVLAHNTVSLPKSNIIKHLIVIAGPTASGKTDLSVSLAKYFNCSVVSADSRQFYKEMRIGTAKPSAIEMQNIPHYFVDTHSIDAPLTAGQFADEAQEVISELFTQSDFVVLVGGSGLFIKALIEGIDDLPGNEEVRQKWNDLFKTKGIEVLQQELALKDPQFAKIVDQNNPVRLSQKVDHLAHNAAPSKLVALHIQSLEWIESYWPNKMDQYQNCN